MNKFKYFLYFLFFASAPSFAMDQNDPFSSGGKLKAEDINDIVMGGSLNDMVNLAFSAIDPNGAVTLADLEAYLGESEEETHPTSTAKKKRRKKKKKSAAQASPFSPLFEQFSSIAQESRERAMIFLQTISREDYTKLQLERQTFTKKTGATDCFNEVMFNLSQLEDSLYENYHTKRDQHQKDAYISALTDPQREILYHRLEEEAEKELFKAICQEKNLVFEEIKTTLPKTVPSEAFQVKAKKMQQRLGRVLIST